MLVHMDWQIFWSVVGGAFGGALIGALTTILVTRMNHKHSSATWLKEQRRELYNETCKSNFHFSTYFDALVDGLEELDEAEAGRSPETNRDYLSAQTNMYVEKARKHLYDLRQHQIQFRLIGSQKIARDYDAYCESIKRSTADAATLDLPTEQRSAFLKERNTERKAAWDRWQVQARADLEIRD